MYKLVLLFAAVASATAAGAQQMYNIWLRGTVHVPLAKQWIADAEVQHRRQSSMPGRLNPDQDLMYSLRPWLRYRTHSHWVISVSPLAWFRSYARAANGAEELIAKDEYRTAAMAMIDYPANLSVRLSGRGGLEYRMFASAPDAVRSRYYAGCKIKLSKYFGILLFDEFFVSLSDWQKIYYDQNRLAASVSYEIVNMLDMELGYMQVHKGTQAPNEGNLFLLVGYRLPQHSPKLHD